MNEITNRAGTTEYVVPAAFWTDHVDRACRCADDCPLAVEHEAEVDEHGYGDKVAGGYRVHLTPEDRLELLSDARHYSDYTAWGSHEGIGLQSSARATVRRLS